MSGNSVLIVRPNERGVLPLRAHVCAIADSAGHASWQRRKRHSESEKTFVARWIRTERLEEFDADKCFDVLQKRHPEIVKMPWHRGIQLFALIFPDEIAHRTNGISWTFIVRRRAEGKHGKKRGSAAFVRADRAGISDLATRLPEFRDFQNSKVAVIGLGCIGAPSALEFARSGVGRLSLLDPDIVEAGTTIRWPYGLTAVGRLKAEVLFTEISRNYLSVENLQARCLRLGQPNQPQPERERYPRPWLTSI
jgi:hypothetical protein